MAQSANNPIAIIGAMPQEIAALTAIMSDATTQNFGGTPAHAGQIHNIDVVVMQCGIGKVNAAIGTTALIQQYQPRAVINTGSAGGVGTGLRVGDVVIGTRTIHHDVDVTALGCAPGQMMEMPITYDTNQSLIDAAQQASAKLLAKTAGNFPEAKVHLGQIASGDQFIHSAARFAEIRKTFPEVLAVEMEAAAIGQVCYRFDIPFVVVRAISDLADAEASISFLDFIELIGKHSAEMVIEMLYALR